MIATGYIIAALGFISIIVFYYIYTEYDRFKHHLEQKEHEDKCNKISNLKDRILFEIDRFNTYVDCHFEDNQIEKLKRNYDDLKQLIVNHDGSCVSGAMLLNIEADINKILKEKSHEIHLKNSMSKEKK